jgi:hypothetical protein
MRYVVNYGLERLYMSESDKLVKVTSEYWILETIVGIHHPTGDGMAQ